MLGPPLFLEEIDVTVVYERGGVQLPLEKERNGPHIRLGREIRGAVGESGEPRIT